MDRVEQVNTIKDEAIEKARVTVVNYATPKKIASIFQMLISFAMMFGVNLIWIKFDINQLTYYDFWIKTILTTVAIFELYRAVINARYDKTANRENVIRARNEYNQLNDKKDLDLKLFLDEFNLQTKISVYCAIQNKILSKLERKRMKETNQRKCEKISLKIAMQKRLLETDYIKEHIGEIDVKYYIVFYDDFYAASSSRTSGTITTRATYDRAFNKASFNKMWIYLLSTSVLAMATVDKLNLSVAEVMSNIIFTAFMIVTRIVTALMEADKLYDSTVTKSLEDKTEILKQYYVWKLSHPTELQKHDEEIRQQVQKEANEKALQFIQEKLTK